MNAQSLIIINTRHVSRDIIEIVKLSMLQNNIPDHYLEVMYDDVVSYCVYQIHNQIQTPSRSKCKHDLSMLVMSDIGITITNILSPVINKHVTPYIGSIKVMPTYSEIVIVKTIN